MNKRKRVFVTGGSRGIGAAIAVEFAKNNYDVAIGYQHGEVEANTVWNQCKSYGGNVLKIQGNIADVNDVTRIKLELTQMWNGIDILINNAGVSHYGMFQDMTIQDFSSVVDTNVLGTCMITQALLEEMIRNKFGRVITISSLWGVYGGSYEVLYSLSKGALNAFTRALAKELEGTGVTVNAVAPGAVDTRMLGDLSEEDRDEVTNDIPLGRMANPEEISKLITHLCKSESSLINGQVILIHGAWHQ